MTSVRPESPDTLIITCCHAIYLDGAIQDEDNWLIEPFQIGETPTFTKHIEHGIENLRRNEHSILAFSGSATKRKKIRELKAKGIISQQIREDRTEAESYLDVAVAGNLFEQDDLVSGSLRQRTYKENYATDSYQNILLGLLQYPVWKRGSSIGKEDAFQSKVQLEVPRKLIIVSHEFKRARFLDLHVPAIMGLLGPLVNDTDMQVEYIGINPPFDAEKMKEVEEGDRKRGYGVWQGDLHGTGELLAGKRHDRGWNAREFLDQLLPWYEDGMSRQLTDIVNGIQ